mmetsp:Transcript_8166/g.20853  ORF Transcript_8166/g.20853 Transcript_8166/m.20853 type:complete len:351 (-) Transcript_8166:168-1220(-)
MSTPLDIGMYVPGAVPAPAPPAEMLRLLASSGGGGGERRVDGELDSHGRSRSSSIDSKVRSRRSLSPRPREPWARPEGRGRAATVDSLCSRSAHRRDELAVEAVLDGLTRSRAWSSTAIETRRGSGRPSAAAAADCGGPRAFPYSGDEPIKPGPCGGVPSGRRPPLEAGKIEMYASPTADQDLDALFECDQPGSRAWRQIPLRHRDLPPSFFEPPVKYGEGHAAGDGDGEGAAADADYGYGDDGVAEGGPITPLAHIPSPNLDSLLGTPVAATHFTYPDPVGAGGRGLAVDMSAATMEPDGVDIIDQLIQGAGGAPASPGLDKAFFFGSKQSSTTTAMDEEFLSNLDLGF